MTLAARSREYNGDRRMRYTVARVSQKAADAERAFVRACQLAHKENRLACSSDHRGCIISFIETAYGIHLPDLSSVCRRIASGGKIAAFLLRQLHAAKPGSSALCPVMQHEVPWLLVLLRPQSMAT